MRFSLPLWAGSLVIIFVSCAHIPQGYRSKNVPSISIVDPSELDSQKFYSEEFSLPFGQKTDGTVLMEEFLAKGKEKGARYVSQLSVTIVNKKESIWEMCTTSIHPEGMKVVKPETVLKPGQTTTKSVLKPVTQMVTEYQYRCHSVSKPVSRTETTYESQYDYYSKTYRSVPRAKTVTRYEYQQECRSEPVTHLVTRYQYQLESQYVPAQWQTVLQTYTHWKLVESEPICTPTTPHETVTPNFIKGTLHLPK